MLQTHLEGWRTMALPENSTHSSPAKARARSGARRHNLAHWTRRWAFTGGAFAALLLAALAGCKTAPIPMEVSASTSPDGIPVIHTGEQVLVKGSMTGGTATAGAPVAEIPEQVLITGSLIRGSAAIGVPVTNLSPQDFAQTGAVGSA